jgi:hypothetical protein
MCWKLTLVALFAVGTLAGLADDRKPPAAAEKPELPKSWTGKTDWLSLDSTNPRGGKHCVKIKAWDKAPGYAWMSSVRIPAMPGKEYLISAWVRTEGNDDGTDFLCIRWFKGDTYLDQFGPPAPANEKGWTPIEATATCPDNATHLDVAFFLRSKKGTVWIDDISLKLVGEDKELLKNGSFEDR